MDERLNELQQRQRNFLRRLDEKITARLHAPIRYGADILEAGTIDTARIETGTITTAQVGGVFQKVGRAFRPAPMVYGSHLGAPSSYLRDAIEGSRGTIQSAVADALQRSTELANN